MKKFGKILSRHCPNGVEYKELQEVFAISEGMKISSTNECSCKGNTIPWFRLVDIRKNGSILTESKAQVAADSLKDMKLLPANSIAMALHSDIYKHALIQVPHLLDQNLTTLSIKPTFSKKVDIKFANYYFFIIDNWCHARKMRFDLSSVKITDLKRCKFPVPPIPVQNEIVSILDNFTNLEAELEAELNARRRQYAYYVNSLFSPHVRKRGVGSNKVKWSTLGEVGKFIDANAFLKEDFSDNGIGFIDSKQLLKYNDIFAFKSMKLISESQAKRFTTVQKGDLIFANEWFRYGEMCKTVAWLGDEEVTVDASVCIYRHSLDPKYVAYFFVSNQFKNQIMPNLTASTPRLSIDRMSRLKIPVPPIEEQQRIVTTIDRINSLINDNTSGLPAEINARRKQTEHYRNKILRLKEAT